MGFREEEEGMNEGKCRAEETVVISHVRARNIA